MLKRTVSLALVLVMVACLFASCAQTVETIFSIADDQLSRIDYTVNTQIVYSSTNEAMNAAIAGMDMVNMTFSKKGHSSRSLASMSIDGVEVEKEYLINAGVLYYTYTEYNGKDVFAIKEKVNLSADEKAVIYDDIGMAAPLSFNDFETINIETNKSVDLVTCQRLKVDSNIAMEKLVKSSLGIDGADVAVSNAELVFRFVDGQYNGEFLTVDYIITIGNTVYDLKMQLTREYDLTSPVDITAPTDADKYTTTTYAELTK